MNDGGRFRIRQAMLLLAALLHLAGAAALPVLHPVAPPAGPVAAGPAVGPDRGDLPAPPAHDESSCLVCQAAHTLADVPAQPQALPSTEGQAPVLAPLPHPRPAPRDAASLARAPPAHA